MRLRHDFIMEANIINPDQIAFYIGSSFSLWAELSSAHLQYCIGLESKYIETDFFLGGRTLVEPGKVIPREKSLGPPGFEPRTPL